MKKLIFLLLLVISIYSFGQSVDGGLKTLTASGTDTYTITEALPAAYDPKERFIVSFANPNTITTPTLNRAALGAKFIKNADGTNPSVGAITGRVLLSYNGTYYQIVGGGGSAGGGSGTVTSVSVTTANGVSGTVANATTTPAISLTLGAITPTTVNGVTLSGSSTPTLAVTGTSTISGTHSGTSSGTNTGDQTNITGNAATVTTNANLTGHVTSTGNAAVLGSFTISQLNTAVSDADVLTSEVDGSVSNELQTITNSSDATSHTVTLSNSGGTVQLIEGTNITLTTGGTASAGTVTINATGGGSGLTFQQVFGINAMGL